MPEKQDKNNKIKETINKIEIGETPRHENIATLYVCELANNKLKDIIKTLKRIAPSKLKIDKIILAFMKGEKR